MASIVLTVVVQLFATCCRFYDCSNAAAHMLIAPIDRAHCIELFLSTNDSHAAEPILMIELSRGIELFLNNLPTFLSRRD